MQEAAIELPSKAYMLPPPIPSWPPVWWFWLVVAGIVLAAGISLVTVMLRHRQNAYRREAQFALKESENNLSDRALIEHCLALIKRCLITEGHDTLASLPSQALLATLEQQLKRPRYRLQEQLGPIFERLYQPNMQLSETERQDLIRVTSYWIRKHRA